MKPVTKTQKALALGIAVLSLFACLAGLAPGTPRPDSPAAFTSIRGERVELQGTGLYRLDSVSFAAQAKAQDLVTLLLGIPLLGISLVLAVRGSLRAGVLQAGTFGYFAYTYATYAFGLQYNPLFLVYIALFGSSVFGLILSLAGLDAVRIREGFRGPRVRKAAVGFDFLAGTLIFLMWMARLLPNILAGADTTFIEHYTTLPIQVMDLGFVVPLALVSGVNLARDRPLGYLLTGLFLMKGVTLGLAVGAMILWSVVAGLPVSPAETAVFAVIIGAGVGLGAAWLRAIR